LSDALLNDGRDPDEKRPLRPLLPLANLILLLVFGFLAYLFVIREVRFLRVPTGSMAPTLLPGDRIVTMNQSEYRRGDIVVVWDDEGKEHLTKRIAGVAGDLLYIEGGALFIDGKFASEPYIAEPMLYDFETVGDVPEDSVFILGDNRNHSDDSSSTGRMYPVSDVVGRVIYIYAPLSRFQLVDHYPLTNTAGE